MKANKTLTKCLCDREVYPNVWKQHLSSSKCRLSDTDKEKLLVILGLKTKYQRAWLKSAGPEAVAQIDWFDSVIKEKTKIEDWTFDPPRVKGQVRPSTASKYSKDRVGALNPMVKHQKLCGNEYDIEEVKAFAKREFDIIKSGSADFGDLIESIKQRYDGILYQLFFVENNEAEKRGFNKQNRKIAYLLDIDVEEWIKISRTRRGLKISQGQASSPTFFEIQSKNASEQLKKYQISKPQKILLEMIRSVDSDASMQYNIKMGRTHKNFDIYSPKYNALIEMHGRVWHDHRGNIKNNKKMTNIINQNIKNDKFKKEQALIQNYNIFYFWDDETDFWQNDIEKIFLEKSISYEDAKNKIL